MRDGSESVLKAESSESGLFQNNFSLLSFEAVFKFGNLKFYDPFLKMLTFKFFSASKRKVPQLLSLLGKKKGRL